MHHQTIKHNIRLETTTIIIDATLGDDENNGTEAFPLEER